jgi:hypothetical protein
MNPIDQDETIFIHKFDERVFCALIEFMEASESLLSRVVHTFFLLEIFPK